MKKQIKLLYEFLESLEYSRTAIKHKIDNSIPKDLGLNVMKLFVIWLSLKTRFPDVIITSGYRCPALNKLVHGSVKSKHQDCLAIDFASMYGKHKTKDMFIPVYEYLRNNHPNVGYIYSDTSGNFIHFQIY